MMSVLPMPLEINLGPLTPHHFSEVLAGLLLTGLLGVIFAKFISPRFEEMYQKRTDEIEGGLLRAEQAQAESAAARAEHQEQLAAAREEAAKVREEAKNQGAAILAQMREQAAQESERMLDQARAQIAAERADAAAGLRSQVGGLATTLAGRIVGETLTDDERAQRTVDEFLADLEALPTRAGSAE